MDPTALFRHGANELNRLMHLGVFCGAGIGALVCAGYALRFWLRARRQRQWQAHLEKIKREIDEAEFSWISRGYYRPREAGELVGAGRGKN